MADVVLVAMPFASLRHPSLAIGKLVAACRHHGVAADDRYPLLEFAHAIGPVSYEWLAQSAPTALLGEWVYARAAFAERPEKQQERWEEREDWEEDACYFEALFATRYGHTLRNELDKTPETIVSWLRRIRRRAERLVREQALALVREGTSIVGSSATFQQLNASLAILREVKRLAPETLTVIGGGSCEGVMGEAILAKVPWVDVVVSGEADVVFPTVCQGHLARGRASLSSLAVAGVFHREATGDGETSRPRSTGCEVLQIDDLDRTHEPAFAGYFEAVRRLWPAPRFTPTLITETSRGCWKGRHRPCTFCGLNGQRMDYRSRSPSLVLQEMDSLARRWGIDVFFTADTVLDPRHLDILLAALAARGAPYKLFFETTANLPEDHLRRLRESGVIWVQPGIENLHDDLLRLLNKGNSAIRNIAFLKFALEQGIYVAWNMLTCIPGEERRHYQEMTGIIPLLWHLHPPSQPCAIRYDRFSPYFARSAEFGLELAPVPAYRTLYSRFGDRIADLAYFFEHTGAPIYGDHADEIERLSRATDQWREHALNAAVCDRAPVLEYREDATGGITVHDTRACARAATWRLDGTEAFVFKAARAPIARTRLLHHWRTQEERSTGEPRTGPGAEASLHDAVEALIDKRLLLRVGENLLTLANRPPAMPLREIVAGIERMRAVTVERKARGDGGPPVAGDGAQPVADQAWAWYASLPNQDECETGRETTGRETTGR